MMMIMMTSILLYSINLQKAWHVELPFQQDIIHTLRNTYSINILREGKRNPLFSNISLGIINGTFLKKTKRSSLQCNTTYLCTTCCIYHPWGPVRVKFWQTTCPWSSNIRVDKIIMATNDIKMPSQILTGTWPTLQNRKQQYLKFRLGT